MSTKITRDELDDVVNEAIKSTLRFNTEQRCMTVDGYTNVRSAVTYFERFVDDKAAILKAANVDESKITPKLKIEALLAIRQMRDMMIMEPELIHLEGMFSRREVALGINERGFPAVMFVDKEYEKKYGTSSLMEIQGITTRPEDRYEHRFEAVTMGYEPYGQTTLLCALKTVIDDVTYEMKEFKNKVSADLKVEDKQASKPKLKM